jgi:hypothetical protein
MEIFEVHQRDIHGGSFRTYVRRQQGSTPLTPKAMEDLQQLEEASGIYDQNRLRQFANKVSDHRDQLTSMLKRLKKNGRSIAAVSAPAKGSTLLNYCGIGPDILDYITEKSELKIGRYSPGQHIPIVADEKLLQTQPDYAIILAWNFAEEIMDNLKDYISAGGKFIIPIPTPHILG